MLEENHHFELAEALSILERTPATLRTLLLGLEDNWIFANEGPNTFSPFDVVGHLNHGEKTDWLTRAKIILEQDPSAVFVPYDRFAMYQTSKGKSLLDLLDEFEQNRSANLSTLRAWKLTKSHLELTGRHPNLGTVQLKQLLSAWVAHDLSHIAQIARVMAKRYKDDVGPWRQYMPLLDR